jgi:predicted regulator of Ras-like GTPase activity (Roadblock/LC7/MglB family)
MSDVILRQEDIDRFSAILSRLTLKARLMLAVLVHKDGHLLASVGTHSADTTALAALVSANFSSTIAIANIIGEKEFRTQFHRGKNKNIFISLIDDNTFVVSVFDDQTSIDIVRVYCEEYSGDLVKCLERCYANSGDFEPLDLELNAAPLDVMGETPARPIPVQAQAAQASPPVSAAAAEPAPAAPKSPAAQPSAAPAAAPSSLPPVLPRSLPHTVRAPSKQVAEQPADTTPPSGAKQVTTETELARAAASISARHATEVQYNPSKNTAAPSINAGYLKKKAHEVRSSEEIKSKNPLTKMFSKQK